MAALKHEALVFLSCLYGSQHTEREICALGIFSKLPIRQSTVAVTLNKSLAISKLPIRQSTSAAIFSCSRSLSKLPIRQSTNFYNCIHNCYISKLPIRQSTDIKEPMEITINF